MMPNYTRPKLIAVDVDGTLIQRGELNEPLVKWIREAKADGFTVYLWSMRGSEYAKQVAESHGVAHLFDLVLGKPGFIVDDMGWGWSRYTKVIADFCTSENDSQDQDHSTSQECKAGDNV